ncbi:MAG TPA: hypothetical protein VJ909_04805 [Prolixibacteraceae bacterium]|nr:hypothetical protein [Prolixibacteraceae bacterium]
MNTVKYACFSILSLFAIFSLPLKAQEWVGDTISIRFNYPDSLKMPVNVIQVDDVRSRDSHFLSVYEQKKALFFPVDQIVQTPRSLSRVLEREFSTQQDSVPGFKAEIHRFYITKTTSIFSDRLKLYATVRASGITDTSHWGTLYYELPFDFKKKEMPVEKAYNRILQKWGEDFTGDLLEIDAGVDSLPFHHLYHFRREHEPVSRNFYTGIDLFAGLNFWGVDAELWFSEPEGNRIFNRSVRMVRYVEHPDFRAIAFGRDVRLWNYRISENWLFTNKIILLFGINNWKDMATASHTLEEILYMNMSFTQKIQYNRFDQKGWVFGLGLMEDAHYIIYHKPRLKIGLSLSCSYKF